MKEKNWLHYWIDPKTWKFIGDFDGMYRDFEDPWLCQKRNSSATRKIILTMLEGSPYSHVLDIGCGLGGFTEKLRQMPKTKTVLGLDISPAAIAKASAKYKACPFKVFDIIREPLPNGNKYYNLIMLQEVIWYVLPHLKDIFDKIYTSLSDNGIFFVEQSFPTKQNYGKEYVDSPECLIKNYLLPAGFEVTAHHIEFVEDFHGHLIKLKKSGNQ